MAGAAGVPGRRSERAAMARRDERLGLAFAGFCALNGAFVPAVAKLSTARADAFFVATATTVLAAGLAALLLGVRGDLPALGRRPQAGRLFLVGAVGTAASFVLFFAGMQRTTAIEGVLCLQIEPAYSLLLAWLFLGHRPTRRRVAAIVVLLLGITLAVGGRGVSPSSGVWLLLITPLCWQASHLIVLRGLRGVSPAVLTGARYVYGGAVLVLSWIVVGGPAPPAADLAGLVPLLVVQGMVLSYGGTLLWYQAITRLDLARGTAIVVPSIPVLSLGVSFVLLGEVPSPAQWVGIALTAAGVLAFVTAEDAARRRVPCPTRVAGGADTPDIAG